MKVLVTGANGMLGTDLCKLLHENNLMVIKTDVDTLDITDEENVSNYFALEKPNFVIHCAAYTNVDKAEDDYEKAHLINAIGTKNIAKACNNISAKLIYISTDYVFDGTKNTPYLTTDKTNPINNYGRTKLEGEQSVQKYAKNYYITRTSWLYGHDGKNFVETMIELADRNQSEIKVVDDQIGCPTWTYDLSKGIIELIVSEKPYGIYHICSTESTTWYEFAKEIFKQTKKNVNLQSCTTSEFPRKAKRPMYSAMKSMLACDWKESLEKYLEMRCK